MILVSEGNLDMMGVLFDRYHNKIFNFLIKMTRDRNSSQDITQEVFYKVIKYRKSYKKGKFSSWIYTIARNTFADHYQNNKHKDERLDNVTYKIKESEHNSIENQEITEQLNRALLTLAQSDKELIIMNRYQGIKYQEIAEIIGSTPGAVKTKIHRAIHKLKSNYFQNI